MHRLIRTAALAATCLAATAGGTLASTGGAQAAVRPAVSAAFYCEGLSPVQSPGNVVWGSVCRGTGSGGSGWLGLLVDGAPDQILYFCGPIYATGAPGDDLSVTGENCVPRG